MIRRQPPRECSKRAGSNADGKATHHSAVRGYLSPRHRDDPNRLFARRVDLTPRVNPPSVAPFTDGFRLIGELMKLVPGITPPDVKKALVMAGLVVEHSSCRAVDDAALSDEILEASNQRDSVDGSARAANPCSGLMCRGYDGHDAGATASNARIIFTCSDATLF
ncbi:MAG: hypothetical protein Udaeo2_21400 [Candidatus Udaeobacter sp.]|nr:MAG: hypothetical protein Udaeo2_21400 [Candidatus Udaeobacter sp.]